MGKIIIVLDNVRSAFNVGSAFRTADGLGAEIQLIGITPIPGKDMKLEKTSLSSLHSVTWKYFATVMDWKQSIENMESSLVLACEEGKGKNTISLFQLGKIAEKVRESKTIYLVFGHELSGVSEDILAISAYTVLIPMKGVKNSLNVATCVGVLGYSIAALREP